MKVPHFHFPLNVGQEHDSSTCTRRGLGWRQQRKWGKHALSVACLFRCHLSCRFGKSRRPASLGFRKRVSKRLRAFCDIPRTTTITKGPGCKVILLIIQQVVEKAQIRLWKLQTMLFINSKQCFSFTIHVIKNSNIVLSAISCWSDNGTESTPEVTLRYLTSTIQEGAGDRRVRQREKAMFLLFRTSSLRWQHPKQMHFTF